VLPISYVYCMTAATIKNQMIAMHEALEDDDRDYDEVCFSPVWLMMMICPFHVNFIVVSSQFSRHMHFLWHES
jgi:hypothetical protein